MQAKGLVGGQMLCVISNQPLKSFDAAKDILQ